MSGRIDGADRRGPLAALLILVGLLLGAGPTTSVASLREAPARLAPLRGGAASSLSRSAQPATLSRQADEDDADSLLPPGPPRIVHERLTARPLQPGEATAFATLRQAPAAAYRARAPPAA